MASVYVPGRKIVCSADEIASEYHTRGWLPAADRMRIDGAEGELRFMVRRPSSSYVFSADISPTDAAAPASVEIFFNYFRVGYFEIATRTEIEIELPAELFILRASVVTLHCRDGAAGKPAGNRATRRPGIALHGWMLA